MYNMREDLFERDAGDSLSDESEMVYPGSSQPNSRTTSLSYSSLASPAISENEDEIYFPSYDDQCQYDNNNNNDNDNIEVEKVECLDQSSEPSSVDLNTESSSPVERSEDDTAVRVQPFMAVDYLSHEWSERDIWSSWKHIRSKRGLYPNSERLENASWRTWEKRRRNLKTVSPETLKWLKDHDVTWLYGPLQPDLTTMGRSFNIRNTYRHQSLISESTCHDTKPILKKPTLSELILRRSASPPTMQRHATSAAQAQKSRELAASAYNSFIFTNPGLARASTTALTNNDPSRSDSGTWNTKNVHFHELVEQRIALAPLGDTEPEYHYVSDSDDDVVVMRTTSRQEKATGRLPSSLPEKIFVSKTIEKLPHTILKSPSESDTDSESDKDATSDTAEPETTPPAYSFNVYPPPSLFGDSNSDDEEDEDDDDEYWKPPAWLKNRRDSVQMFHDKLGAMKMHTISKPTFPDHCDDTPSPPDPSTNNTDLADRNKHIRFELPPCRSQLASFSFGSTSTAPHTHPHQHPSSPFSDDEEEWCENIDIPTPHHSFRNLNFLPEDSDLDDDTPPAPLLNSAKTALVDRVMDEFWVVFNEGEVSPRCSISQISPTPPTSHPSPNPSSTQPTTHSPTTRDLAYTRYEHHTLPKLVRSAIESKVLSQKNPVLATLVADLGSVIRECQGRVLAEYQDTECANSMDGILSSTSAFSPTGLGAGLGAAFASGDRLKDACGLVRAYEGRASSDSGYGSEDREKSEVERYVVRDQSMSMGVKEMEMEKGVRDWNIYPGAWDEDEEAVAWEEGF